MYGGLTGLASPGLTTTVEKPGGIISVLKGIGLAVAGAAAAAVIPALAGVAYRGEEARYAQVERYAPELEAQPWLPPGEIEPSPYTPMLVVGGLGLAGVLVAVLVTRKRK